MLRRRSLRHAGGRLALLAVLLQFALSFAHIHPSDIFPYGHPVAQGLGVDQIVAPQPGSSPVQRDRTGPSDQACAICANMALAASIVLPNPVGLPPPPALPSRTHDRAAPIPPLAAEFLLFQTRAPPTA
jgi:hypothetical protein